MAILGENVSVLGEESFHRSLLGTPVETPLGRILLAGEHRAGTGVRPRGRWRVYGSYAVVVLMGGAGSYRDQHGGAAELLPGDVVLVFPELGHWYGPARGGLWSEIYVTFDGPAFDLLRGAGLLDPARPVRRLAADGLALAERLRRWTARLDRSETSPERLRQVIDFLQLLGNSLTEAVREGPAAGAPDWLSRAKSLLETDLGAPRSAGAVAEAVGMGYETFRKRFQRETGTSPMRYRTQRRLEAARQMLRFSPHLTNRQIAEALGFADEFHFSKRFAELVGDTPRTFRRRNG